MGDLPVFIQFIEWAQKLSDDELRQGLEVLGQEYKDRMKRAEHMAALALREGDWVENVKDGKRLPAGAKGHIVKIRRGTIDVHFPEHGMWKVSATLVRKVDPPPTEVAK